MPGVAGGLGDPGQGGDLRLVARFKDRSLRDITPALGRRNRHSTEKARVLLGWQPRPARTTVVDCARSLIAHGAVGG
ncbi:hypothetical protein ACIBAC_06850 [Streptomyces sp. NPDC051362]|uniref:hypothetical protein n=1 Tax=Streptomyces sp. NPDC051362 TaxID=3365651 RepID=UPI0037A8917C